MRTVLFILLTFSLNAQTLQWTYQNDSYQIGDTVEVQFKATGFTGIGAYQFALQFDTGALKLHLINNSPVTTTGALYGLSQNNFSWHGKPGYPSILPWEIRTVWSNPYGKTIPSNTHVFSVWFVAKQNLNLCSEFWLWSTHPILKPRAYKAIPLSVIPMTVLCTEPAPLVPNVASREDESVVQIYPNPVTQNLIIESTKEVKVQIFNLTGELTHKTQGKSLEFVGLSKGLNFVLVDNKVYKIFKQ